MRAKKSGIGYLMLIVPAMLIYFIFSLYPAISTYIYSVTDRSLFTTDYSFIGFDNFKVLFDDEEVMIGMRNSLVYAVLMTIIQNGLAIPLAVALDKKLRTKNWLRMVFFAPAVLSPLIVGYLWSYIMSSSDAGLINNLLGMVGLPAVNWLGEPKLALYSILITQVWQWTGWAMVIYLANLQSIPKQLFEAAHMDGANGWQTFWKVTLPQLIPSITINTILSMIGGLKVFDIIYSMTSGGPGHATESIVTILIKRAFTDGDLGFASAFAVVFSLCVLLITAIQLKIMRKWDVSA